MLDQQRQSESSSRECILFLQLCLCSGPNTDEPLSPSCRGGGQQSHDFPLGSSVEGSLNPDLFKETGVFQMVGCVIRVSQASIPVVWSSEMEHKHCRER